MSHNMNKYFDQVATAVLLAIRNAEQRLLDRLEELDDRVAKLAEKIDKVDQRIAKKEHAIEGRGQPSKTKAQKPAAAPSNRTEQ
jgi:prefoldin subunit 5